MRIVLNIIGILSLPVGTVWILQGFDVLKQGFMAGHKRYAALGVIVIVIGLILLVVANWRKKS